MATINPFAAIRPVAALASRVAALPYDVYNRKEAAQEAGENPYSFLHIDKAEIDLPENVDPYSDAVYEQARHTLLQFQQEGILVQDPGPSYYIYALTMEERTQVGLVCCSSVDDYLQGIIKRHELTREDKELDRIRHVATCNANTGPIFLTYRSVREIQASIQAWMEKHEPINDFHSSDKIRHQVWVMDDPEFTESLTNFFAKVPTTYIADGHHRAASAVQVALQRRKNNPNHTGQEAYNCFLSVLFPEDQLKSLDYNRVVRDLNGMEAADFIKALRVFFDLEIQGKTPYRPKQKREMSMYLEGIWYRLSVKNSTDIADDPVSQLDVSVLQKFVLEGLLGIEDIRRDSRIDFVGGIRGLGELERRCQEDMKVAFALFPTSVQELMDIADAGLLMPPKSTWFEPKLRSGLFIHPLGEEGRL